MFDTRPFVDLGGVFQVGHTHLVLEVSGGHVGSGCSSAGELAGKGSPRRARRALAGWASGGAWLQLVNGAKSENCIPFFFFFVTSK